MFANVYQSLQTGYQQSWLKFLFRNTSLTKLITQKQEPSAFVFFKTYLSSWWWNRWWFRSCIEPREVKYQFDSILECLQYLKKNGIFTEDTCFSVVNNKSLEPLVGELSILHDAGILTKPNFMVVATHANPKDLAVALSDLQRARILTEHNRTLVANHASPYNLAVALSDLQRARILTDENFRLVAKHAYPCHLAVGLSRLQQVGILTEHNRTLFANHASPCHLAVGLSRLQRAGILTEYNRNLVANHANPSYLVRALFVLQRAGILNEENQTFVANHADPHDLADALSLLQRAEISTKYNQNLVANHASPCHLAVGLSRLQRAGILTEYNRNLVANHANPSYLVRALSILHDAGILTQANFVALTDSNHAELITMYALNNIWNIIPPSRLTQANFARLVTASEADNPREALQRVINQIMRIQAQAGHAAAFNPGQSTHTASVHHSVSASASRLMESYGAGLNVEEKIKEINTFVMGLDDSPKHPAAKICIARMTRADYAFIDSSNVSTRQLLALAWVAIHDRTKCHARVKDAKALFVEGLYEIQRGYNIDDLGNDLGGEDSPICVAGTFNKLMEKLNGIHSDVEVYYITHAVLCIKFPKVVAEHALRYLNLLANPKTETEYLSIKALLDSIKENGLRPIWDNIKSAVKAALWDEFKAAYANNPKHYNFIKMIEHGYDSNAPDLTELYNTLEASPGYRAFLYQLEQRSLEEQKKCLGLLQHSLWTNRHESPEAQNIFDRQYGLVLRP